MDGFLAPPASIASEGPTLDLRGWSWGDNTQRRAKRLPLQHLRLSQAPSSGLNPPNLQPFWVEFVGFRWDSIGCLRRR